MEGSSVLSGIRTHPIVGGGGAFGSCTLLELNNLPLPDGRDFSAPWKNYDRARWLRLVDATYKGRESTLPPVSSFLRDSFLLLCILWRWIDMEGWFPLLTYELLLEPFNERCHDPKEDLLAQHYSTCGVPHTLLTTTAAVTSLVPYLTKSLDGRSTPKANSALGADPTPTGGYSRAANSASRYSSTRGALLCLSRLLSVRKPHLFLLLNTNFWSTRTCRSTRLQTKKLVATELPLNH